MIGTARARRMVPVALFLATLVLAACANSPSKGSSTRANGSKAAQGASTDPGDSPYCDALMTWGAYDWFKPGGEGFPGEPGKPLAGQPGAVQANQEYQRKYLEFATRARQLAPPEIRQAWDTYFAMGTGPWTALLEQVGYDLTKPKFLAVLQNPPAEIRSGMEAFEGQIAPYEKRVCGSGPPPPAEVQFAGKPDRQFCQAQGELDQGLQSIVLAGTEPAAVRSFLTSPSHDAALDRLEATAPSEIKDDVIASNAFMRDTQIPLAAEYGFDLPKLMSTGASLERHEFNAATPEIADHTARINAYVEQMCGSEG
jgi:hypothetical protein